MYAFPSANQVRGVMLYVGAANDNTVVYRSWQCCSSRALQQVPPTVLLPSAIRFAWPLQQA